MPDVCGTCKAPVVWALSPAGARSPIDRDPDPKGNVLLLRSVALGIVWAITLSKGGLEAARDAGAELRLNHWASCVDKAEWRERQAAKKQRAEG